MKYPLGLYYITLAPSWLIAGFRCFPTFFQTSPPPLLLKILQSCKRHVVKIMSGSCPSHAVQYIRTSRSLRENQHLAASPYYIKCVEFINPSWFIYKLGQGNIVKGYIQDVTITIWYYWQRYAMKLLMSEESASGDKLFPLQSVFLNVRRGAYFFSQGNLLRAFWRSIWIIF
jgi:hypothetical protein